MISVQRVIRFCVCLHAVALLLLPKDGFWFLPSRPDDITAVILLVLFVALALAAPLEVPGFAFATVVCIYAAYFLAMLISHDFAHGYVEASAFYVKELSYVVFGYFVWRAYRDAPYALLNDLTLITFPNIAYGLYQLLSRPRGMYGVAPFGHESSPASAGMVYFTYAIVLFMQCLWARRPGVYRVLLAISGVLVIASGSKVAVVGAACFFGWYLLQGAIEARDARSLRRFGSFVLITAAGLVLAASWAAGLGYSWRGLSRYRGLLEPIQVLANRGIWWKFKWIDNPVAVFLGAGYSPAHLLPGGTYSFGMAMDNEVLYYLVTGGVVALALYAILMTYFYTSLPSRLPEGKVLRSLVLAYLAMGLGGEVLQLSVHGDVFWLVVGLCFARVGSTVSSVSHAGATVRAARSALAQT